MKSRSSSASIRSFFGSKLFLITAFVITFVFAYGFARAYYKDYNLRQEVKRLEQDIALLEKKKIESIELLKYVSSSSYVEDAARIELNLKKPGEQVVFLDQVEKEGDILGEQIVSERGARQHTPNPIKWWYYFIHSTPPEQGG